MLQFRGSHILSSMHTPRGKDACRKIPGGSFGSFWISPFLSPWWHCNENMKEEDNTEGRKIRPAFFFLSLLLERKANRGTQAYQICQHDNWQWEGMGKCYCTYHSAWRTPLAGSGKEREKTEGKQDACVQRGARDICYQNGNAPLCWWRCIFFPLSLMPAQWKAPLMAPCLCTGYEIALEDKGSACLLVMKRRWGLRFSKPGSPRVQFPQEQLSKVCRENWKAEAGWGASDEQGELLLFCRANVAICSDLTGLLQFNCFEALRVTHSLLPTTLASINSGDRAGGTPLPAT